MNKTNMSVENHSQHKIIGILGGLGPSKSTSHGFSQDRLGTFLNKSCPGFEPTDQSTRRVRIASDRAIGGDFGKAGIARPQLK